jgi:hypothetical protein
MQTAYAILEKEAEEMTHKEHDVLVGGILDIMDAVKEPVLQRKIIINMLIDDDKKLQYLTPVQDRPIVNVKAARQTKKQKSSEAGR